MGRLGVLWRGMKRYHSSEGLLSRFSAVSAGPHPKRLYTKRECQARKWRYTFRKDGLSGRAGTVVNLHINSTYSFSNPQRKTWGGVGWGELEGNALHLPWSQASRHEGAQPPSCGEMGYGCSSCGAPSGIGGVSVSQLGMEKTPAGVGHPPAYAAGACSGLPAGGQRRAGASRPCPRNPLPTPRIRSGVGLPSGSSNQQGDGQK